MEINSILMEFQNFHGRVVDLFHYVFHNTHCSVPPVGLHKSTYDGLTTTTPTLTSQSLFYVQPWRYYLGRREIWNPSSLISNAKICLIFNRYMSNHKIKE